MNLKHLAARLAQSGYISEGIHITMEDVKDMLCQRFRAIDYTQAKLDVTPFIKNPAAVDVWSSDFFCEITEGLDADH